MVLSRAGARQASHASHALPSLVFVTNPWTKSPVALSTPQAEETEPGEVQPWGSRASHSEPGLPPIAPSGLLVPSAALLPSSSSGRLLSTYFTQLCTLKFRGDGAEERRGGEHKTSKGNVPGALEVHVDQLLTLATAARCASDGGHGEAAGGRPSLAPPGLSPTCWPPRI